MQSREGAYPALTLRCFCVSLCLKSLRLLRWVGLLSRGATSSTHAGSSSFSIRCYFQYEGMLSRHAITDSQLRPHHASAAGCSSDANPGELWTEIQHPACNGVGHWTCCTIHAVLCSNLYRHQDVHGQGARGKGVGGLSSAFVPSIARPFICIHSITVCVVFERGHE